MEAEGTCWITCPPHRSMAHWTHHLNARIPAVMIILTFLVIVVASLALLWTTRC